MQASAVSRSRCVPLCRAPGGSRASRTCTVKVQAYLDATTLRGAVRCVPSPFVPGARDGECCTTLLEGQTHYRGSAFFNDLFLSPGAQQDAASAFGAAVQRWASMYTPLSLEALAIVADPTSQDAFVLFSADMINTGSFGGAEPTMQRSGVLGTYRLHLDAQGRLSDVWCFRSGTQEERQYLLKGEAAFALPPVQVAVGGITRGSSSRPTTMVDDLRAAWPSMAPCPWASETGYVATMAQRAAAWSQDVMGKGCISSLLSIAAKDVRVWDGTALLHPPLEGVEAVGHHLVEQLAVWEAGPRQVSCTAVEPGSNKVFMHWTQASTARVGGGKVTHSGITMLVFNAQARIQQVLDFVDLNEMQRGELLRQGAADQLLSTWASRDEADAGAAEAAAAAAAEAEAEAAAKAARKQAEVLARQEAEWMSW